MTRHFLKIRDCAVEELRVLLTRSAKLKDVYARGGSDNCLAGKKMVMLFEKPSSRTRISFDVAMTQLSGTTIYIRPEDIGGLGQREPIRDLARVLNGYVDIIVARTFSHQSVVELAQHATVPVINALTDLAHPCQAMADVLTIQEHCGQLEGCKVAYIGDGNNVARSLAVAAVRLGMNFAIAAPKGYELTDDFVKQLAAESQPGQFTCTNNPDRGRRRGQRNIYRHLDEHGPGRPETAAHQ